MTRKRKPQLMFGAVDSTGWVPSWTIQMTARGVRKAVGSIWGGWKAAQNDGMKIVKIQIRVVQ